MPSSPEISPTTVNAAVRELHRRTDKWPTREQLAAYLDCEIAIVKDALAELRRKRIVRDRRRSGETRWMPWSEW